MTWKLQSYVLVPELGNYIYIYILSSMVYDKMDFLKEEVMSSKAVLGSQLQNKVLVSRYLPIRVTRVLRGSKLQLPI